MTSVPFDDDTRAHPRAVLDLAALAARRGYVIRVTRTLSNGGTRSQHYSSLHAALRGKERAEAAGCVADLVLCRVEPVGPVLRPEVADVAAVLQDFDEIGEVDVPAVLALLGEDGGEAR